MFQLSSVSGFATALLLGQAITSVAAIPTSFNVTAIAGENNESVLQCWQLATPFIVSNDAGTKGVARVDLSDADNVSYLVVPANFDGGLHAAPANQWVYFISGLAEISVPQDPDTLAFIEGGEFGLIFAGDFGGVSKQGHITKYPGTTETIGLQIPTKDNEIPAHTVLHAGACTADEITGLHDFAVQSVN